MDRQFKSGDRVAMRGCEKLFVSPTFYVGPSPLNEKESVVMSPDGDCYPHLTSKIMRYKERTKPIKVSGWVNMYRDSIKTFAGDVFHDTKKQADRYGEGRVACVHVSGTEGEENHE